MSSNLTILRPRSASAILPDSFPHGGGVEAAANVWKCEIADILDLSTGLHPAGPPAWLGKWLHEHASLAGRYSDSAGEPARGALAAAFSVKPEQVLITAGAQATIEVIFQAMAWQSMAIQIPCYNEPIRCAKRAGCDVRVFESGTPPAADILWLTSPSNPTGENHWPCSPASYSSSGEWRGQRVSPGGPLTPDHSHPICLDESYMPFSQRRTLGLLPNVLRIGSLTKAFCIPGLRLGYVIAYKQIINQLAQWLPPWPASTLAQHLLPELLAEADGRDEQIIAGRFRLQALLESCDWQVRPSQSAFLLAKPRSGRMPDFSRYHILVRQFPEWPQLAGWIRFGLPGDESDWQRLKDAITLRDGKE